MISTWLLVLHIAVVGYWLGSELVINANYRYVCCSETMPFAERTRLMEHVMNVDQHVRYALVLQANLGTTLAATYGFFPGGGRLVFAAFVLGIAWLAFIEIVHRMRYHVWGPRLASLDLLLRYGLMIALVAIAVGILGEAWVVPEWLRWKLGLFAAVIACGVGIRFVLIDHFRTWQTMGRDGPSAETNRTIKRTYVKATSILGLLWIFIFAMTGLSVWKQ